MLSKINLITLTTLGYIDFKTFKIPNSILCGWILTITFIYLISTISFNINSLIGASLIILIYYPLRKVVKCNAGDFKLFAVLMLTDTPYRVLQVCFISMLISLIPLVSGVKKVPVALTTLFGYGAFLLTNIGV